MHDQRKLDSSEHDYLLWQVIFFLAEKDQTQTEPECSKCDLLSEVDVMRVNSRRRALTQRRVCKRPLSGTAEQHLQQSRELAGRADSVQERRLGLPIGGEDGHEDREGECRLERVLRWTAAVVRRGAADFLPPAADWGIFV